MKTYSFSEPFIPDPIWVSPDGNDETGDGTQERPFRQIQTAIDKLPSTVVGNRDAYSINVEGGTYNKIRIRNKVIWLNILDDISIYSTKKDETAFDIGRNSTLELAANESKDVKISLYNFEICFLCQSNSFIRINAESSQKTMLLDLIFNNENVIEKNQIRSFLFIESKFNLYITMNITNNTSISHLDTLSSYLFCLTNAANGSIEIKNYDTYNSFTNANLYNRFITLNSSSNLSLKSDSILTIGSNYDVGLYVNGSILNIADIVNNATLPTSKISGGRIFMGNTTEIRQTLSDANMSEEEILRLEKILSESNGIMNGVD